MTDSPDPAPELDLSKAEPDAPARPGAPLASRFAIAPWIGWALLTALCVLVLRHGVSSS